MREERCDFGSHSFKSVHLSSSVMGEAETGRSLQLCLYPLPMGFGEKADQTDPLGHTYQSCIKESMR